MTGAGDLDRRIEIHTATETRDSFGGASLSYSRLTTVWAQRVDASDAENRAAGGQEAVRVVRWLVRSSETTRSIDARARVVHGGRTYEVTGVSEAQDRGRRAFLWISSVVRNDAG